MTGREQARQAVRFAYGSGYPEHAEIAATFAATYEKYADAASDVWEPVVRSLLEVIEAELGTNPPYDAVREAKEALGQ